MMMKKLIVCSTLLLSIFTSAQEVLRFKGTIKGISNEAKVILSVGRIEKEVEVKDGAFDVQLPLEKPESVYLYVDQNEDFKYAVFYLGNEDVLIEGSLDDFPMNIQAKNSKHDALRYQAYQLTGALQRERDQLEDEAYELIQNGASKDSLYELYMGVPNGKITLINEKIAAQSFDFIKKNINTDYGRFLLKFHTLDFTKAQFQELLVLVDPLYKETKEIKFIQTLADYPTLEVGELYYDFEAKDMQEKKINFSSFFDGKYVLLDFSTWFCGYCQRAAPRTAILAEQLKSKLNYVTYYVDGDKESLAQYYTLKNNKGTIVWNEAGSYHTTIAKYRQMGTPHYILFDPKGKIIKIFEGIVEDFEEQIKQHVQG